MSEVRNNQDEERAKEEHDEVVNNAEDKENLESSKVKLVYFSSRPVRQNGGAGCFICKKLICD